MDSSRDPRVGVLLGRAARRDPRRWTIEGHLRLNGLAENNDPRCSYYPPEGINQRRLRLRPRRSDLELDQCPTADDHCPRPLSFHLFTSRAEARGDYGLVFDEPFEERAEVVVY